jgi:hypothetical protein
MCSCMEVDIVEYACYVRTAHEEAKTVVASGAWTPYYLLRRSVTRVLDDLGEARTLLHVPVQPAIDMGLSFKKSDHFEAGVFARRIAYLASLPFPKSHDSLYARPKHGTGSCMSCSVRMM